MGIGRKATDQRTPCRKFLATPLWKWEGRWKGGEGRKERGGKEGARV